MRAIILLFMLTIAGCGTIPPPTVDMTGVDAGQHSRDLADCQLQAAGIVALGNPISKCMEAKGYRVLVAN